MRKNPEKNLTQGTCPDRGSKPGPLRDKRACYHLLHSVGPCNNNWYKKWEPALHFCHNLKYSENLGMRTYSRFFKEVSQLNHSIEYCTWNNYSISGLRIYFLIPKLNTQGLGGLTPRGREYLTCELRRRRDFRTGGHNMDLKWIVNILLVWHNICDPSYESADVKLVVKLHDNIFETIY